MWFVLVSVDLLVVAKRCECGGFDRDSIEIFRSRRSLERESPIRSLLAIAGYASMRKYEKLKMHARGNEKS